MRESEGYFVVLLKSFEDYTIVVVSFIEIDGSKTDPKSSYNSPEFVGGQAV